MINSERAATSKGRSITSPPRWFPLLELPPDRPPRTSSRATQRSEKENAGRPCPTPNEHKTQSSTFWVSKAQGVAVREEGARRTERKRTSWCGRDRGQRDSEIA